MKYLFKVLACFFRKYALRAKQEAEIGLLNIQKITFIAYDDQFDRVLWIEIGNLESKFCIAFGSGFKLSDYEPNTFWDYRERIMNRIEPLVCVTFNLDKNFTK